MNTNGIDRKPKDRTLESARELGREQAFTMYSSDPAHPGLTKREYLAAQAMQGLIGLYVNDDAFPNATLVAREAFAIADAMLLEAAVTYDRPIAPGGTN